MMEQDTYLKVENHLHLVRDTRNNAILNTNEIERQAYLARKNAIKSKNNKLDMMEKRIANLEAQVKVLMDRLNEF